MSSTLKALLAVSPMKPTCEQSTTQAISAVACINISLSFAATLTRSNSCSKICLFSLLLAARKLSHRLISDDAERTDLPLAIKALSFPFVVSLLPENAHGFCLCFALSPAASEESEVLHSKPICVCDSFSFRFSLFHSVIILTISLSHLLWSLWN